VGIFFPRTRNSISFFFQQNVIQPFVYRQEATLHASQLARSKLGKDENKMKKECDSPQQAAGIRPLRFDPQHHEIHMILNSSLQHINL
jgi:hypothetical protein